MGNAQGAAARDHAAIFYNPANLVLREKTHLGIALSWVAPQLHIEPDPLGENSAAKLPQNNVGLSLGLNFPLGGLLDYRVAVGLALFLPLIQLTRIDAVDPSQPYFYMYESLPDHLVIAPAIGVRIFDELRLGAGVQILAAFDASFDATGDVLRRRIESRSLGVELAGATAPIVGLASTLGPVEIGLTFRDELELEYSLPVDFRFEGIGTLTLGVDGSALYNPRQLNLGVAVNVAEPRLVLAADLTAAFWSRAPDPAMHVEAVVSDAELRPSEETIDNLFEFSTTPLNLGAEDIFIPRLGAEWAVSDVFTLRAGYYHRAAVIPDQTGYGNVLDAAANVFSLGAGATFPDPLHVTEELGTIDVHVQLTSLRSRSADKSSEAGATVDETLVAGGAIWHLGIEFHQDF